ncbi:hypothetical protein [Streptosporangium sp. NPDC002524]|uniref:hypothetical protein n=1 Tax=Streptosporangium sp. NPDC002524 TaxID=3154537 RepID=UPI00331C5157
MVFAPGYGENLSPRFASGEETPRTIAEQRVALAELGLDATILTGPGDGCSSRQALEQDVAEGRIERVMSFDENKPI